MTIGGRNQINWPDQVVNFIGVVVGVLLALWLTNWNEGRKEELRVRVALENIQEEILKNQANIERNLPTNDQQLGFIKAYLAEVTSEDDLEIPDEAHRRLRQTYPEFLPEENSSMSVNFELFPLSRIAYETTIRTGLISLVDFDLAYQLEQLYLMQKQLEELDQTLLNEMKAVEGKKASVAGVARTVKIAQQYARSLKDHVYPACLDKMETYIDR